MTNQIAKQVKTDYKAKAIISLVLGIISVGLLLLLYGAVWVFRMMEGPPFIFLLIILFSSLLSAILGLIFGILNLKSTKRNFAIAGIILCLPVIILILYFLWHF